MCQQRTIYYPCREHVATRTTTVWCPHAPVSMPHGDVPCPNVRDMDAAISLADRMCLFEACPVAGCLRPTGTETVSQWRRLRRFWRGVVVAAAHRAWSRFACTLKRALR